MAAEAPDGGVGKGGALPVAPTTCASPGALATVAEGAIADRGLAGVASFGALATGASPGGALAEEEEPDSALAKTAADRR